MKPITKGWNWGSNGWTYDDNNPDTRDDQTRTIEEISKSLNEVWKFLDFTMEGEMDFDDGFLPTLDFKTKVESNGYIRYRFFSKPMSSNTLLLNGTALSKSCVFNSLRQELLRRLYNSDFGEGASYRCQLISDFIQKMVNSGHKYQYIKSVVLQALTKYSYVIERSELDPTDARFCPVHRPRSFDSDSRKLLKYTNQALWYSHLKPGDKYKDCWKRWITRKDTHWKKHRGKKHQPYDKKNVTSVMFVPKTVDGKLSDEIQGVEDKLSAKLGWCAKVVEKPGQPLHMRFSKSFHMEKGCSRGAECQMCEGKGSKCTPKRGVYRAICLTCKNMGREVKDCGIYIGESSRQVGDRVLEHYNKAGKFHKDSFIVRHWTQDHYLDANRPQFKFTVVRTFKDALSRQLLEAVLIRNEGNLNAKQEFTSNELIRLQTSCYSWDEKCKDNKDRASERRYESILVNFKNVMLSVKNKENDRLTLSNINKENECLALHNINQMNAFRFQNKRKHSLTTKVSSPQPNKKTRTMDNRTSTPLSYRQCPNLSVEELTSGSEVEVSTDSGSLETSKEQLGMSRGLRTELESGVGKVTMTPQKQESLLESVARGSIACNERLQASEDFRRRTSSLPAYAPGAIIKPPKLCKELNRSKSVGDLSLEMEISQDCTDSFEQRLVGLDISKNAQKKDGHIAGIERDDEYIAGQEKNEYIAGQDLDEYIAGQDENKPALAHEEVVLQGEEGLNDDRVEELIRQKTKNALYSLFIKASNWEDKLQDDGEKDSTFRKRKCESPERETPRKSKQRQCDSSHLFRPRTSSTVVQPSPRRLPRIKRNKSETVPRGQPLLTSVWPKVNKK